MNESIYVIEDDENIQEIVKLALESNEIGRASCRERV